jgi:voltage-gated potassium channel
VSSPGHDPEGHPIAAAHEAPRGRVRVTAGHVRAWLLAVVAAIVTFTVLFWALEGWSVSDALFMTVTTLTTVGYGQIRPLDEVGRVVAMGAAVTGAVLLFGGVGIMAEVVLAEIGSGRRERRKMQERIAGLSGHYIVCGFGRVGATVARELDGSGQDVVVVDILPESIERARAAGFLVVAGDATTEDTLLAAGLQRAAGLVATIDEDVYNVYVVLSARTLNPTLFIVGRANLPAAEARLKRAGADRVVSPYTMAGHRIAELAVRPAVSDYIDAALSRAHLSFSIEEVRVSAGGPLDGMTVGQLLERGIFTLAVVRGPGEWDAHPPAERPLQPGEELILSASRDTLRSLVESP